MQCVPELQQRIAGTLYTRVADAPVLYITCKSCHLFVFEQYPERSVLYPVDRQSDRVRAYIYH